MNAEGDRRLPSIGASAIFVAAALVTVGCSGDTPTTIGQTRQSITGGTAAQTGDFASVVAIAVNGDLVCSGVVITPTVVLSAARCFSADTLGLPNAQAVVDATTIYVGITDFNATTGPGVGVATIQMPPDYVELFHDPDLSLVELKSPAGATPAEVNLDPSIYESGKAFTLVGFGPAASVDGGSERSSSGVLRSATSTNNVGLCASVAFALNGSLCFDQRDGRGACYDAGGPSFIPGTSMVAGIHSYNDADCSQYSVDARVDAYLSFIAPTLCADDGYCAAGCGTNSTMPDPDCTDAGVSANGSGGSSDASTSTGSDGSTAPSSAGAGGGSAESSGGRTAAGTGGTTPTSGGTSNVGSGGSAPGTGGTSRGPGGTTEVTTGGTTSDADAGHASLSSAEESGGCGCRVPPDGSRQGRGAALALACCVALASCRRRRHPNEPTRRPEPLTGEALPEVPVAGRQVRDPHPHPVRCTTR